MVRTSWTGGIAALALAMTALAMTALAMAAPAIGRAGTAADCRAAVEDRLAQADKDRAALAVIAADTKAHGLNGLVASVDDLQAMLDRAPATAELPRCEGAAPGAPTSGPDPGSGPAGGVGAGKAILLPPSPYVAAALLLGSVYVELQQWPEAHRTLSRGLALAPANPGLVTEDALALNRLGRTQEGLDLCDRLLAAGVPQPLNRARALRTRGFLLGELKRYDEGILAYRQSLEAQPGNDLAQREIAYLERRKAGGPPAESSTLLSKDSQAGRPTP